MNDSNSRTLAEMIAFLTVSNDSTRWIDTASQPALLSQLGKVIAKEIYKYRPDAVACWLAEDDVLVAHTIARVLGIPVYRAQEDLGLLTLQPEPTKSVSTVVMIAASWRRTCPAGSLYSMLSDRKKNIPALISLLPGDGRPSSIPDDCPYLVLGS